MLREFKIILWRFGILRNCPICGSKVLQKGHTRLWTVFICTNCDFGKIRKIIK